MCFGAVKDLQGFGAATGWRDSRVHILRTNMRPDTAIVYSEHSNACASRLFAITKRQRLDDKDSNWTKHSAKNNLPAASLGADFAQASGLCPAIVVRPSTASGTQTPHSAIRAVIPDFTETVLVRFGLEVFPRYAEIEVLQFIVTPMEPLIVQNRPFIASSNRFCQNL